RLFWALCKAHRLSWSESWLLRRVARDQGLRHPGRLFLEVHRWDEKSLGPRFALEHPRLKDLRDRIFGEAARSPVAESLARPSREIMRSAPPLFPTLPSPTLDVP